MRRLASNVMGQRWLQYHQHRNGDHTLEASSLLIFAFALLIAAGSPGPSTAALVARVLVTGWRDVMPFVAAMLLGELIWLTCAIAGLATIAERFHWAFLTLKYCGVAYLVYLAWQMWTASAVIDDPDLAIESRGSARIFFTGIAVTLGNPKIMLFYLALLPTIVDLNGVTVVRWMELGATMLFVLLVVYLACVVLASRARVFLRSPFAVRITNRIGATLMGGAAAVIATRQE